MKASFLGLEVAQCRAAGPVGSVGITKLSRPVIGSISKNN